MSPRQELIILLEERTLSMRERRKRRLKAIGVRGLAAAIEKARKGQPLTLREYAIASLGFLPGEPRVR